MSFACSKARCRSPFVVTVGFAVRLNAAAAFDPLLSPPRASVASCSLGRRRKIFFQFFFPLVVAFPDFRPAGSGGREFRLDGGAALTGDLLQGLTAQTRFEGAAFALVEAVERAVLMPEILHFAAVTADEGRGLQALLCGPAPVLSGMAKSGEGIEARDARKESHNALGLSGGAFMDHGRAAGILQFGKRLSFFAMAPGELLAFQVEIFAPDSLRLLQRFALLARCLLTFSPRGFLAGVSALSQDEPAAPGGRGPARWQRR